ncbi:hypothetical protein CR513_31558, partial [Mucuna pruriens]
MFRKVEIIIPLLDAIKQIPKYAKFLKELCVHKRRKMKGSVVSALTKNNSTAGISQVLPKKCRDPRIFSVPCTIGDCTFANAMLDLGASINVPQFRRGMTIQLANRSIVQPLGVLEDVLVQVNELIFPADFYVLDMEDETSGKESTLILGKPFLMIARTKIEVHARTLSMEFINSAKESNMRADTLTKTISANEDQTQTEVKLDVPPGSESEAAQEVNADPNPTRTETILPSRPKQHRAEIMSALMMPSGEQGGQTDLRPTIEESPSLPPMELKPLLSHLKYAYLDIIIANNLLLEQEDKLLKVLRQHKKRLGGNFLTFQA